MEVLDAGLEPVEQSTGADSGESQQQQQPDPKQADREYTAWLKTLREDGDSGKHYRRIKDDFSRLQTISKLDPKGLDGIRERYAAIDGVAYGDKKGLEALPVMRSALAESQAALDAIAQGDFKSLSEDQRAGILRSTPQLLDTLAETDADGYVKAVLPHFVDAIKNSQLYTAFGQLVDTLAQEPPKWMKPEQKADWVNDRLQAVLAHATTMGQWFKAQEERVKGLGGTEKPGLENDPQPKPDAGATANPQFWKDSVYPETNAHAEKTFNDELRPWSDKLAKAGFRLSDAKKQALAGELVQGVMAEANKNNDYKTQMARYNRQRTPDKASIVSLFRSEFNRHAPNVMKALIERDYGQILDKRTAPKPNGNGSNNGTKPAPIPPQKGVKIVSVKPQRSDIDFPRTPANWLYQNKWMMKDGSIQQYRP